MRGIDGPLGSTWHGVVEQGTFHTDLKRRAANQRAKVAVHMALVAKATTDCYLR